MKLPRARYEELASAPAGMPCPSWTAEAARRAFGLDLTGRRLAEAVLVRGLSPLGYSRASYELNLGCNWDCEHCYRQNRRRLSLADLGLRPFTGGSVRRTDWDELEAPVRLAIEARTGRVHATRTASAGLNSQLAVVLDTDAGTVFVKGLRVDHPGVVRQGREATINPFVPVAPRLLWHDQAAGWDVLAFEYIDSVRHADYRPGSPDLPRVIDVMHRLAAKGGRSPARIGRSLRVRAVRRSAHTRRLCRLASR